MAANALAHLSGELDEALMMVEEIDFTEPQLLWRLVGWWPGSCVSG